MSSVPSFLKGYETLYASDPRSACLQWFQDSKYGLFLHYGLYSLLGRHEWVQHRERIPVADYALLANSFVADGFDAAAIADLALDAGMRYVNITTRHHDSFCLFCTGQTEFQSPNAPCGRDLVAELAQACESRGLGLFLYYSHGRDWRHPHAPNNDAWGGNARPDYDPPESHYAYGRDHNLDIYLDFVSAQIRELLTQYGPIAGIWLDGVATPLSGDRTRFRCQELYDMIHGLQPQVLVSYKQGLVGTEDFAAPEHRQIPLEDKPGEICTTMAPRSWGYTASTAGTHKSVEQVWDTLAGARSAGFNLLLNSAPLPDGSLDPEDTAVLRRIGQRIRESGFPS